MPDNKNRIAAALAIMAMLTFMLVLAILGFGKVPPENKDFFNSCLIALISFVGTAYGYYLGSSFSSGQKNALLAQALPPAADTAADTAPDKNAGFATIRLLLSMTALAAIALTIAACATTGSQPTESPLVTAGKTLLSSKSAIVATATATDGLCRAQKLPAETCIEAKDTYEAAKPLYDAAVDSYLLLSQGGDPAQFDHSITRLNSVIITMQRLAGGAP
jgi:hypothetical protein